MYLNTYVCIYSERIRYLNRGMRHRVINLLKSRDKEEEDSSFRVGRRGALISITSSWPLSQHNPHRVDLLLESREATRKQILKTYILK